MVHRQLSFDIPWCLGDTRNARSFTARCKGERQGIVRPSNARARGGTDADRPGMYDRLATP